MLCSLLCLVPMPRALAGPENRTIIGDDHGGVVSHRERQVARLRQQGQRIEIRGEHCLSSCTMLLSLPRLCVHPDTRFGFHGPSDHGTPLLPHQFDFWSRVISAHYPPPLRQWYMRVARYKIRDYYYLSGQQLSAFGIRLCKGPLKKSHGVSLPPNQPQP